MTLSNITKNVANIKNNINKEKMIQKKTASLKKHRIPKQEQLTKIVNPDKILTHYDFKSPQVKEVAFDSLLKLAAGLPVGTVQEVSQKTVLDAIKLIIERAFPLDKNNMATNQTFIKIDETNVDLNDYKPKAYDINDHTT